MFVWRFISCTMAVIPSFGVHEPVTCANVAEIFVGDIERFFPRLLIAFFGFDIFPLEFIPQLALCHAPKRLSGDSRIGLRIPAKEDITHVENQGLVRWH